MHRSARLRTCVEYRCSYRKWSEVATGLVKAVMHISELYERFFVENGLADARASSKWLRDHEAALHDELDDLAHARQLASPLLPLPAACYPKFRGRSSSRAHARETVGPQPSVVSLILSFRTHAPDMPIAQHYAPPFVASAQYASVASPCDRERGTRAPR